MPPLVRTRPASTPTPTGGACIGNRARALDGKTSRRAVNKEHVLQVTLAGCLSAGTKGKDAKQAPQLVDGHWRAMLKRRVSPLIPSHAHARGLRRTHPPTTKTHARARAHAHTSSRLKQKCQKRTNLTLEQMLQSSGDAYTRPRTDTHAHAHAHARTHAHAHARAHTRTPAHEQAHTHRHRQMCIFCLLRETRTLSAALRDTFSASTPSPSSSYWDTARTHTQGCEVVCQRPESAPRASANLWPLPQQRSTFRTPPLGSA